MLPQILVVNPMRKRHRRQVSRARVRRVHRRTGSRLVRRARRRAVGYVMGSSPIRRRKLNPFRARHMRRHRHRNPFDVKGLLGDFIPAGVGGVSAVGLDVALAYIPLPAMLQSGWGNWITRIAGSIGLVLAAGMVAGKRNGEMVTVGALTVTLYSIIRAVLSSTVGANVKGLAGLADFKDFGVGAYMQPGMAGVGAYMNPQMGAYMNPGSVISAPAAVQGASARTLASRRATVAGLGRLGARSGAMANGL